MEGALWQTATGPHRKPVEQAKYQPAEKEVALRGHSCVAAGDVGKRQRTINLWKEMQGFQTGDRLCRCSFEFFSFFLDPKYLEMKVESFAE